jgi:hypothetical protein
LLQGFYINPELKASRKQIDFNAHAGFASLMTVINMNKTAKQSCRHLELTAAEWLIFSG